MSECLGGVGNGGVCASGRVCARMCVSGVCMCVCVRAEKFCMGVSRVVVVCGLV